MTLTEFEAMEVRNSIGLMKMEDARNNYGNHATAIKVLEAVLTQQPAPPAEVPMLTPEEIDAALHVALPSLSYDSEDAFITGVRVGEKLVRQKAGLP